MPTFYPNDNKLVNFETFKDISRNFARVLYWDINLNPIYMQKFYTCKDLRKAFEDDLEGTFLTLGRLNGVGNKSIMKIYEFVSKNTVQNETRSSGW